MRVRILTADDDAQHHELRLRALRDHPESFLSGPEDQERLTPEERRRRLTAAEDGSKAAFGAFDSMGILLGTAGVIRGDRAKVRHTASLFAMYVAPEARGAGSGRAHSASPARRCAVGSAESRTPIPRPGPRRRTGVRKSRVHEQSRRESRGIR